MRPVRTVVLLGLTFTGCLNPPENADVEVLENRYYNHPLGISVQFPSAWRVELDVNYPDGVLPVLASAAQGDDHPAIGIVDYAEYNGPSDPAILLQANRQRLLRELGAVEAYRDSVYRQNGLHMGEARFESDAHGAPRTYLEIFFIRRGHLILLFLADRADRFDAGGEMTAVKGSLTIY